MISGGVTFASQMLQGACLEDAFKAAVISGASTAFSVTFAAVLPAGLGTWLINSLLTTYTNGALQATINGRGSLKSALYNGFTISPGALLARAS